MIDMDIIRKALDEAVAPEETKKKFDEKQEELRKRIDEDCESPLRILLEKDKGSHDLKCELRGRIVSLMAGFECLTEHYVDMFKDLDSALYFQWAGEVTKIIVEGIEKVTKKGDS